MLPISEDELATRLDRSVSYLEVGLQCGGFTTGFTTDGGYSSVFVFIFIPSFSVITLNCNSVSIADASSIINLSFVVLIIIIFFILLK